MLNLIVLFYQIKYLQFIASCRPYFPKSYYTDIGNLYFSNINL